MKTTVKTACLKVFRKLNKSIDSKTKHARVKTVNGNAPNDRLAIVIKDYDRQIEALEKEILTLKAKRRTAVEIAGESEKLRPAVETPADKYATFGTTEAVQDAIECLWRDGKGAARGVIAAQIRDFMLSHGFNPNGEPKNFSTTVGVTLNRLLQGKRIEHVEFLGKNYYRPVDSYK